VGAKFVSPWAKKAMFGQILFCMYFFLFLIHPDCTCQNEKKEESGETKN